MTGLLRIHAPRGVLDTLLIPILTRLAQEHPRLTIEVRTDTFPGDIVAQGCDAGIRIRRFIQQDMVTTQLTRPVKLILVASRDYLDAKGTPKSIPDLRQHNCIGMRNLALRPKSLAGSLLKVHRATCLSMSIFLIVRRRRSNASW